MAGKKRTTSTTHKPKAAPPEAAEAKPQAAPEAKKPRYSAEGILLNPEDFHVSPEGIVQPK